MSAISIQSINLIDNQITVLFNQSWFQEDIITLRQLLIGNISGLYIKEVNIGADLENVRFQWLEKEFILNFDYYSQSCWFDTDKGHNIPETQALFNFLMKHTNL